MPIYEYKCGLCSCCFEIKQSFQDSAEAVCHQCGGNARRIFSPVPIVFKGSGFYTTDNAREERIKPLSKRNGNNYLSADNQHALTEDAKSKEGVLS